MEARFAARRLGASLLAAALLWPAAAAALDRGERAPLFDAPRLDGPGRVSLAQHRGKVVYLDFWASWCPPCLSAMPQIDTLREEFSARDFQILAINVDRDLGKARRFLEKLAVGYPSATDPEGRLPESFAISTMPTSFLIDREGVIRYVHAGFRPGDIDTIRTRIRRLLAERE